jgi:hypothetical protein
MRHVLGLMALVLVSRAASAQSVDTKALAEQLFNQARELAKAEKWEEACPKFEASLRYEAVLGTQLNLATCYEHVGKLASAWGLYRDAAELARKAGDDKRAAYAQTKAGALVPRLPTLRISVASGGPAELVVERDGVAMTAGEFGVALYVDPGEHVVAASAPGHVAFERIVATVEGKAETLSIPPLAAQPAQGETTQPSAERAARLPASPPPPLRPSRTRLYAGLGVGAAGLVAAGVGVAFGLAAKSKNDDAKQLCGDDLVCDSGNFQRGKELVDDARSKATRATVLMAVGGVAIVAGTVLVLTAPRAKANALERATARLVPTAHPAGAGFALLGRF